MAVKIYIWETRANLFKSGINFNWQDHGHTSALVDGVYVSFWPADDSGTRKKFAINTRSASFTDSYSEDCGYNAMKRTADCCIDIYKLNEYVMLSYWGQVVKQIRGDGISFDFMESNCSTVVGRMLMKGWKASSGHLASSTIERVLSHALRGENHYWEPEDVLNFARAIKGALG